MRGQQPQLAYPGFQVVRALHVVDPVASDTISLMRVRGSAPVKYWLTRRRRSTAVPT